MEKRGVGRTLFPDGIGRKALIATMVVGGWIAFIVTITVIAFNKFNYQQAIAVAEHFGTPLGTAAFGVINLYLGINFAGKKNGNGGNPPTSG